MFFNHRKIELMFKSSADTNKTYWRRETYKNQMNLLLFSWLLICINCTCEFNEKCDFKCRNQVCEYDPSTNSYYNSSISNTSAGYHGQGCCTGCQIPYSNDHIYDSSTKSCWKGSCPKDSNGVQQYWHISNTCVYQCHGYFANPYTGACEYKCSSGYYELLSPRSCVENCPTGFFKHQNMYYYDYSVGSSCQPNCREKFANHETGFCQSRCRTGYADDYIHQCVHNCSKNRYKDNQNKLCVEKQFCGIANSQFANDLTISCEKYCSNDLFGDPVTNSCLSECPPGYFKFSQNLTIDFENITSNLCVTKTKCNNHSQMSFININTRKCEFTCSEGLYGDYFSGQCISTCPINTYTYEATKICLLECSAKVTGFPLVLDLATNTCQISLSLSASSTIINGNNISISQTIAISVGVITFLVIAGLIVWNIYIMARIKKYTRVPMKRSEQHIDIHFQD